MNFFARMYGSQTQSTSNKAPTRVAGGLKAQGVDRFTMVAEDGSSREIPTVEYVRSLEEQIKKQRAAITVLERKLGRLETSVGTIKIPTKYE